MYDISRRQFLAMAGALVGTLGLGELSAFGLPENKSQVAAVQNSAPAKLQRSAPAAARNNSPSVVPMVAEALQTLASGRAPILWLQGQSCSGCSVSFLNATYPDVASVLTQYISLGFHSTISGATGAAATDAVNRTIAAGGYILVVEGAVPGGLPKACETMGEEFGSLLTRAAKSAAAIVAAGTCAAFGGIPSAPPNPTGAVSVSRFLASSKSSTPLINLPGCPTHPDWLVGTLVHLMKIGVPPLTEHGSPQMFYGESIHSRCPEFYNYNMNKFARFFGDSGCLFKLGCMGIRTNADCSIRRWNNKTSWCVEAGAPCIGCARPEFAQDRDFAFYREREKPLD